MIDYNVVYVVVWSLAFLSMVVVPRQRDYLFYGQVVLMTLFVALKFETGYDWPVYEAHYLQASVGDQFYIEFEYGYELLVKLFVFLGVGFHQFVAVINIVEISLVALSIRYFFPRHSIWIMAMLYAIPDFYLIPSFSLLRQVLAASLFLFGLRCHFGGRRLLAWVVFGLAISMHYSVVGALLFVFLALRIKLSRNVFVVLFVISVSLYLLSVDIARSVAEYLLSAWYPKYLAYLDRDIYNASIVYRLVYASISTLAFGLIYISWSKRLVEGAGCQGLNLAIYRLAMLGVLIPLVVYGFPTFSTRYQYFFCFFTLGVCLSALKLLGARDRLFVLLAACFISYIPFYRFLTNPLSVVYIPYQSQFFYDKKNSTGQQRTDDLINELESLWSK
jgi:hypothetical protein